MSDVVIERWEALGNVYFLVEEAALPRPLDEDLARTLCARDHGPGADGVLGLTVPGPDGSDVFMRIRNPDGSASEACGNGTRMVARWFAERTGATDLIVGSDAGPLACRVLDDGRIAARLARATLVGPQYDPEGAPFPYAHRFVAIGNPHVVIPVEDPADFPLEDEGPALERHPRFPARTNVDVVSVVDPHRLRLRVWERGVGETAACGTGACAAAVAGVLDGRVISPVLVELPGGTLEVVVDEDLAVTLIGPAERQAAYPLAELIGAVGT